jgi:dTDP-4-dehydrorhamnose 3,5-epimerase-like enzyme
VKKTSVLDANICYLSKNRFDRGSITSVNNDIEIPFQIKRVYYLYDVPCGVERGGHAHKKLHQFITALSGSFDLILDDGNMRRSINLNSPNVGVYIPPGLWRDLNNFSSGTIVVVLASDIYSEDDYIRMYEQFVTWKKINL